MLATLGALASQKKDYAIWDNGNPHDFYFLCYGCVSPEQSVWVSMEGYEFLFPTYILIPYGTRVGIGYSGYVTVERPFDLSRYSKVELTVNAQNSTTVRFGTATSPELGVEFSGFSEISSVSLLGGETKNFLFDIPSGLSVAFPAFRFQCSSVQSINAKILKWRLLR